MRSRTELIFQVVTVTDCLPGILCVGILVADLEEAWIELLAGVEIIDRNSRIIALWIGYRPLTQLEILGAELQHQTVGANQLLFLNHNRDKLVVSADGHEMSVAREV